MHKSIKLTIPRNSPLFREFEAIAKQYYDKHWGVIFTAYAHDGRIEGYIVTDGELDLVDEMISQINGFSDQGNP